MESGSLIATIGFGATVFMLWFLGALLHDGVRWSRYRVARSVRKPRRRKKIWQDLSLVSPGAHLREVRSNRPVDRVELLENENHEKGEYGSGLSALDIGIISGKFGGRTVNAKYSGVRWERSL